MLTTSDINVPRIRQHESHCVSFKVSAAAAGSMKNNLGSLYLCLSTKIPPCEACSSFSQINNPPLMNFSLPVPEFTTSAPKLGTSDPATQL